MSLTQMRCSGALQEAAYKVLEIVDVEVNTLHNVAPEIALQRLLQ